MDDAEAGPVRVALGIRDVGTCELLIPRDRWDLARFVELMERQGVRA